MNNLQRLASAGPLLLLGLLMALLVLRGTAPPRTLAPINAYPATTPLAAQVVPVGTATPEPRVLTAVAEPQADWRTADIDLVDNDDIYPAELEPLAGALQDALNATSERTGMRLSGRVRLVISRSPDCAFHGVTYSTVRVIQIYSCEGIPAQRVVNIAAHEYVHQLAQDRFGAAHLSADLLLSEGIATWGAGGYWLGGRASFEDFAREYRSAGYTMPLDTHYSELNSIDAMNALYYQWASFTGFLIETYGRERFDALYVTGQKRRPGSADYRGIYGSDLEQLQAQWELWLDPPPPPDALPNDAPEDDGGS